MSDAQRDTYKYHVKEGGKVVARGVTNSLERREAEIRERFPNAHIKQVGRRTTRKAALIWERRGAYSSEELEGEAMSDIGRCQNPDCNHKWDREENQTCPKCGTVYVPPEPYETPVTAEIANLRPLPDASDEALQAGLAECVRELRRRGWSWERIRNWARGVAASIESA